MNKENSNIKISFTKDFKKFFVYNDSYKYYINKIKQNGIMVRNEYFSIFEPMYKYILRLLESDSD